MIPLINALVLIIRLYWMIVIASVIFSWLYAFGIVNPRNQVVSMIGDFLYRATEPVYRQIRRILPSLGGIDLSPLVVLLILYILEQYITIYLIRLAF